MHDSLESPSPKRPLNPPSPVSRARGVSVRGFLARVALLYLGIAYFIACPRDPTYAVCHQLDTVSARLITYEPTVRPYVALVEERVEPYLAQARPYIELAKPYYAQVQPAANRAESFVRPYVVQGIVVYTTYGHPLVLQGIAASQRATKPYVTLLRQQYSSTLAPTVEWYTQAVLESYAAFQPRLAAITAGAAKVYPQVTTTLAPLYTQVYPLVQHHAQHSLLPFAQACWSTSGRIYRLQIHPRVLASASQLHATYTRQLVPALHRFWSVYVEPQLEKVREKIFEYRSLKEERVAVEKVEQAFVDSVPEVDDLDGMCAHQHSDGVLF